MFVGSLGLCLEKLKEKTIINLEITEIDLVIIDLNHETQ